MDITAYIYIVAAYLIGAIPFGLFFTKLFGGIDVRTVGSGNIGATNVLRAAGKKAAVLTLLADGLKGFLPVYIAGRFFDDPVVQVAAGVTSFLGHLYPLYLSFRGGKGVATGFGVSLGMAPWFGFICLLTWLGSAILWKYSSLAALIAFAAYPLMVFSLKPDDRAQQLLALFLFAMIYYRHRENIKRLVNGEEPKIGQKKPVTGSTTV
ncbi:MAG: glycerol-3-phosphate 1-O-acyltransferase PlsY [Nitrospirota bacterium]|nr:glycerol-3-phosphate 1-O-acyltransferase PlsY [Nitrospirota bacterium]